MELKYEFDNGMFIYYVDIAEIFYVIKNKILKNKSREELIDIRDCFLRFANAETSRAFFFRFDNPYTDYVTLKLFNEKPVISVVSNNTLPLPYLLTKLYNL